MSSKFKASLLTTILTVFILASGIAGAVTEDFSFWTAKQSLDVCACDFAEQYVTMQNTGDVTSTYIVEQDGQAGKWSTIAPNAFYLEPGEGKELKAFIKIPCSARGEKILNTSIKTVFDKQKDLIQTVNVQNCPNVQINPKFTGPQQECPCTPVQYDFDIVNTGKHIETYDLWVEPYSEGISISTDLLVMEPGEKQTVTVFINLNCGEYGNRTFTLNALAHGTQILGQSEFSINIDKCYDYDLLVEDEYSVCQGLTNSIDYTIQNNAEISNTYNVFLTGPEWVSTNAEPKFAWGGDYTNGQLLLNVPVEEEGTYDLTLQTVSDRGEETREKTIRLISEKCHDYALAGDTLNGIQCKDHKEQLWIQNIGSRRTTFWLETEGPEWLKLEDNAVNLDAGEEVPITFDIDVPCDAQYSEYLNTLYVTIDATNETYAQEQNIKVTALEDAYLPDIDSTKMTVGYEGGSKELTIKNTGILPAGYDLELNGPSWVSLDGNYLELQPGETGIITLTAAPTNETAEDGYLVEILTTIEDERLQYSTSMVVEVAEQKTISEMLSDNLLYILLGIGAIILLVIIIVVITILGKKGKKKPTTKKTEKAKEEKPKKKAIGIDKKEYSKPRKKEKKTPWGAIIGIILLILLIGAGSYFAYQYGANNLKLDQNETTEDVQETAQPADTPVVDVPTTEEPIVEEPIEETKEEMVSLFSIDRSAVPGKGNELVIDADTEAIELPLKITNPTDRNANFEAENTDWIGYSREKLTVKPESEETITVTITPDHAVLDKGKYETTIKGKLEGKKIAHEEAIDVVIKHPFNWLPWLLGLGALVVLVLLIVGIVLLSKRPKKPKAAKPKKEKKVAAKPKKAAKKKTAAKKKSAKKKKESSNVWLWILLGLIAIILIGSIFVVVTKLKAGNSDVESNGNEETAQEPAAEPEEPKLTEEDFDESLITIDRSQIPGNGNKLLTDGENISMPVAVNNPTDKTARFTVNTANNSWIRFDDYQIIVQPEETEETEMTIVPDEDVLKDNDYNVQVTTSLQGEKIDYEETLGFVVAKDRGLKSNWWLWVLLGLLLCGLGIGIVELLRRRPKKATAAKKKGKKKAAKKPTKKKAAKKSKKTDLDKDIEKIRKRTEIKIRKKKI